MTDAYATALSVLGARRASLAEISRRLLDREVVEGNEIRGLLSVESDQVLTPPEMRRSAFEALRSPPAFSWGSICPQGSGTQPGRGVDVLNDGTVNRIAILLAGGCSS
jgi:hypothetical protein